MLQPLDEYVIVRVDEKVETPTDALIEPTKLSDTPISGVLKEAGESTPFTAAQLSKVRVWFRMWAGQEIESQGTMYTVLHIRDCLAYEEI